MVEGKEKEETQESKRAAASTCWPASSRAFIRVATKCKLSSEPVPLRRTSHVQRSTTLGRQELLVLFRLRIDGGGGRGALSN